jgi:DNA-binding MarR family transcriptional regulator
MTLLDPAQAPAPDATARTAAAARLRLAIGRLGRIMRQQHPGGLTPTQLSALVSVERCGPLRLSELAAIEAVSAPTATRLVASLEADALVDRRPDPDDGRSVQISLSRTGKERLDSLRRERTTVLVERIDRLDPASFARLVEALPVLESLLDDGQGEAPARSAEPV